MIVRAIQDIVRTEGYSQPTKTISKDKEYRVYGVLKSQRTKDYYVTDDTVEDYPIAYPSDKFEVIEESVSENWVTRRWGAWFFKKEFTSFPEWANDLGSNGRPGYYERLVDAAPESSERQIFQRYKQRATGN